MNKKRLRIILFLILLISVSCNQQPTTGELDVQTAETDLTPTAEMVSDSEETAVIESSGPPEVIVSPMATAVPDSEVEAVSELATAADSFAPIGPFIVTGLNYNDLLVETRLNGETVQSESTANLIHSVDAIVSYTSRYITLEPGDIIYTGTPGSTQAMLPGDVVEVEVEGVGILTNTAQDWDPDA